MIRSFLVRRRPWTGNAVRARQSTSKTSSSTTCSLSSSFQQHRYASSSFEMSSPPPPPQIDKVLIANRGEIACRVIRTCRRLGIPTVALYSTADGPTALHARMADECYQIGTGPSATESYLLQDDIVQLAVDTGATAVHPGYGFLSENASFCQGLSNHGIAFIGPPTSAITAMGSKSQSKAIMEAAGVPTTPGYYDATSMNTTDTQDAEFLRTRAHDDIGYPVLIKAVSGGGGKGMRLVWNDKDFLSALQSCQHEARNSFGDARVLLEKYLVRPRHVEVQVVADQHGNVVSLHERDCSLQRRHQKIIEEAPASDLDVTVRQELGSMGRKAAQAVGYVNAGTVEFLFDTQSGKPYFCEMNTRLQVEHPITEEITGIDLVEWQLRVAAGEKLPITDSADIPYLGHAFEARIYAENPARNFLPATGKVWHHAPPAALNTGMNLHTNVRVDTCIQSGLDVSVYYDPMISKLIVRGENRTAALQTLVKALKNYQIAGVPSNIDFLIKCAQHPVFGQAGAVNTGFLEDYADQIQVVEHATPPPLAQAVGAFAAMLHLEGRRGATPAGTATSRTEHPWSSHQGSWRMGGAAGRSTRILRLLDMGGESSSSSDNPGLIKCISNTDGSFEVQVIRAGGTDEEHATSTFHVTGVFGTDTSMQVMVNHSRRIQVTTALKEDQDAIQICMWPQQQLVGCDGDGGDDSYMWDLRLKHPYAPSTIEAMASSGSGEGSVKAPMPGKISRLEKQVGDEVNAGDVVLVMEAMKMEHSIRAPAAGVVTEIRFKQGDIVGDGDVLLIVANQEEEAA